MLSCVSALRRYLIVYVCCVCVCVLDVVYSFFFLFVAYLLCLCLVVDFRFFCFPPQLVSIFFFGSLQVATCFIFFYLGFMLHASSRFNPQCVITIWPILLFFFFTCFCGRANTPFWYYKSSQSGLLAYGLVHIYSMALHEELDCDIKQQNINNFVTHKRYI